jgi:CRP-like cAMP-binding protein
MADDDHGTRIIRHKVSRQDMAKVVGASREMVSRVMKDLEERGVIETQENGAVILKDAIAQE